MKKRSIQHKAEYLFVNTILLFIKILPKSFLHPIGVGLGLLIYYLRIRRQVVIKNLTVAFGSEYNKKQRHSLARAVYKNTACVLIEFLYMSFILPEQISDYFEIEGLDIMKEAVNEDKGVVLASGHFGNWELMSAALCTSGYPFYVYAGQQKNQLIDDVINSIRTRFGQITISKSKTAPFEMLRALKKKNILGMAGDLNVPHDNLFVDFFGKKAAVGQGLATYALRCQTPLIFIWNVRTGPLMYSIHIERLEYKTTGDSSKDVENVTQKFIGALEDRIRMYPDRYFWFNRRWKTRPADDKSENLYS